FAVRGTYCDLAIKLNNKIEFLIEIKAIGLSLKEAHLRQAIEYGANSGAQWIILTSGLVWQLYKLRFEKPIKWDFISEFTFDELDAKNEEHLERLFILCKEGLAKEAREDFHKKILTINRFILGALILSDELVGSLRRELRKLSDGVNISPEEITKVLSNEVLKRDVLDGEEAAKAQTRVRRFYGKTTRRPRESLENKPSDESDEPKEPEAQQNIQTELLDEDKTAGDGLPVSKP
ncbi:MAG: type I restriction enzyme HsdR N-terminal domain-containing protein, partial [Candidatus Aminicenantes bacterium]|nr:type I restriction enzyme HsdR N-terminal domain-containing protein [Candidatus Aminicenantes bacterium]